MTLSRHVHDEQETERGERRGRGVMVYEPLDGGRRHIRFSGPEGDGEGVLGLAEPEWLVFPVALEVGGAAAAPAPDQRQRALPGDPARPTLIEITFVEDFICRATPAACDGVASWSREFAATATPATSPPGAGPGR